jgi:hypothetical protein
MMLKQEKACLDLDLTMYVAISSAAANDSAAVAPGTSS